MDKFKPKIFALILSAGVLLMSVIFLSLNPSIVGDAYAAALGWRVAIAAGPGPGPYRGSVQVYDENNMASDSDKGLATQQSIKAYADSLVLTAVDGYTLTGPMTTSGGTASITMATGTNTTINGIFTLRDGGTLMVGATWQTVLPGFTGAIVLSTLVTNKPHVANSVWLVSNGIAGEGSSADDYEGTIVYPNVVADRSWTMPIASDISVSGVINHDTTLVQIDSQTEVDGSTAVITLPDAGGGLHIACGGTIFTDNNGTRTFKVLGGGTAVCTLILDQAKQGHYSFEANVTVMSATTVIAWCTAMVDGFTPNVNTNYLGTTLDISVVTEWTVLMDLGHNDDAMSMTGCIWTYKP